MDLKKLENSLEAIFFANGDAIKIDRLTEIFNMTKTEMKRVLNTLKERYTETSLELISINDNYQLIAKVEYGKIIKDVMQKGQNVPLSQAAMEVLAVVAYNEPVTRSFIEQTRGVDSSGVIYNLVDRGLLQEAGRLDLPGRPIAYETTTNFLRSFSLQDLSDLPNIEDFDINTTKKDSSDEE